MREKCTQGLYLIKLHAYKLRYNYLYTIVIINSLSNNCELSNDFPIRKYTNLQQIFVDHVYVCM